MSRLALLTQSTSVRADARIVRAEDTAGLATPVTAFAIALHAVDSSSQFVSTSTLLSTIVQADPLRNQREHLTM